jgi:hypothetical protein
MGNVSECSIVKFIQSYFQRGQCSLLAPLDLEMLAAIVTVFVAFPVGIEMIFTTMLHCIVSYTPTVLMCILFEER